MRLIRAEAARHDWERMTCGCGASAAHLARDLLESARETPAPGGPDGLLEGHVWSPATLWEPAPAVTSVALAALADTIPPAARTWFLDLLQLTVAGEGTDPVSARRGLDLPERCRTITRQGLWSLYGEVVSGRCVGDAGTAFEILTVVEPDRARLRRVREAVPDLLPVCCRTGFCDGPPEPEPAASGAE
ncbi:MULTISPECIES: hypothetical protein [Streptomyces]|nr:MULTISPECIES: hypothetical protein [Streptomyces]UUS29565.1 hypothetical protein NRO40_01095 [Streptomyces changanensis]